MTHPQLAKNEKGSFTTSNTLFMAKVSHDLRLPLNAIIGFAELMYHEKVGPTSSLHKEYLNDILTSARHLLLLINDVMDIAKLEAGKMDFHPEKINFKKIFKETKNIFDTLIADKNIQFNTEVDADLPTIYIDPVRIKQIIYNYVSNALKCVRAGGQVTLRVRKDKAGFFRLEVEDNGIGVKTEDLKRLFVEFQQLDRDISRKHPGTGLGLALTKHMTEAMGGTVGVTSTHEKGSIFYAILPCDSNIS